MAQRTVWRRSPGPAPTMGARRRSPGWGLAGREHRAGPTRRTARRGGSSAPPPALRSARSRRARAASGGISADGVAWQRFPPTVAIVRIWTEPSTRAASTSADARRASSSSSSIARIFVSAPIRTSSPSSSMPASTSRGLRSTSQLGAPPCRSGCRWRTYGSAGDRHRGAGVLRHEPDRVLKSAAGTKTSGARRPAVRGRASARPCRAAPSPSTGAVGYARGRMPVASATAFAISRGRRDRSRPPRRPSRTNGPRGSIVSTRLTTMRGTSTAVGSPSSWRFGAAIWPSKMTSCLRERQADPHRRPALDLPLDGRPGSAPARRRGRPEVDRAPLPVLPVASSTSTSAACAANPYETDTLPMYVLVQHLGRRVVERLVAMDHGRPARAVSPPAHDPPVSPSGCWGRRPRRRTTPSSTSAAPSARARRAASAAQPRGAARVTSRAAMQRGVARDERRAGSRGRRRPRA